MMESAYRSAGSTFTTPGTAWKKKGEVVSHGNAGLVASRGAAGRGVSPNGNRFRVRVWCKRRPRCQIDIGLRRTWEEACAAAEQARWLLSEG